MHTHPGDLNVWLSQQDIQGALQLSMGLEVIVRDYQSGRSLRITWSLSEVQAYQAATPEFRNLMVRQKLEALGVTRLPLP
jgi:hypothetical protein